jgi:arylsulfatase A-like enzyme
MSNSPRNVLLITADQWRGDCLSVAGHPVVQTPNIDALAARGTLFERHYTNAVPCGPSRACIHTGLYLHNHRSLANGTPLDARFDNWASLTRAAGMDPVVFGYTHTAPDPRRLSPHDARLRKEEGLLLGVRAVVDMGTDCTPWVDYLASQGYEDLPERVELAYSQRDVAAGTELVPAPMRFAAEHSDTSFLVERCIEWLSTEGVRTDGPGFCAHLSLRAPHPPWIAYAPWHTRYPIDTLPDPVRAVDVEAQAALHPWLAWQLGRPRTQAHADRVRHAKLQAGYYGLMSEVDEALGRLFAHLDALGARDDTLIVFTSDHGEQMGDHWLYGKCGWFESSFHVPMIVDWPGKPPGRSSEFTEHVDILPTLLDWLGLPPARQCDGQSLAPLLGNAGGTHWRDAALFEFSFADPLTRDAERHFGLDSQACLLAVLRTDAHKYVGFSGLPPLLFDMRVSEGELVNLAERDVPTRLALAERLLARRLASGDTALSHLRITDGGVREGPSG